MASFSDIHYLFGCITPLADSAFPFAFGFPGALVSVMLNIPFKHKLSELCCRELWSAVGDQSGRDSPSREV